MDKYLEWKSFKIKLHATSSEVYMSISSTYVLIFIFIIYICNLYLYVKHATIFNNGAGKEVTGSESILRGV